MKSGLWRNENFLHPEGNKKSVESHEEDYFHIKKSVIEMVMKCFLILPAFMYVSASLIAGAKDNILVGSSFSWYTFGYIIGFLWFTVSMLIFIFTDWFT